MVRHILDAYERKARYAPAMLAVLPLAALVLVIVTTAGSPAAAAAGAIAVEFGIPVAMSNYTRSVGKAIEGGLWASWGGPPTTARLRHRNSENCHELGAVHRKLQQLVPEVKLPTLEEECADPAEADKRFEAAVKAAIPRLRDDPSGRLLFEENCAYGFWRNSLALRPAAMAFALTSGIASILVAVAGAPAGRSIVLAVLGAILDGLMFVFWSSVSPRTVERAAVAYADAFRGAVLGWSAPASRLM